MRMADLRINEFEAALGRVLDAMSTGAGYEELVARASVDAPIIGELMDPLLYYKAFLEKKKNYGDCGAIQRDMVVLLALRHLEKAEIVAAK